MKCISCNNKKFVKIIQLGSQALSCKFLSHKNEKVKSYPLTLIKCLSCELIQLSNQVSPSEMYGEEYGYFSGISPMMRKHLKTKFIENKKYTTNKGKVMDIGSNDGTLLNFFAKEYNKIDLFGIDPNIKIFSKNYDKKIQKFPILFNKSILKLDQFKPNSFNLIFSIAMFYDVPDPLNFIDSIKKLLTINGVWVLELSYLKTLSENMTYDQICHEHIAYYSIKTLNNMLIKKGLKIIKINLNEINGGSIELKIAKKNSKYRELVNLKSLIIEEDNYFSNNLSSFKNRVSNSKINLRYLINLISKKHKIYGYGASTKGNIILNYLEIDSSQISKICDANKFKINRYTPGSKIKIITKKQMRKENPDFLFVLIWSFRNEVIKQELNYIKNGGVLIIPYPTLHFIDNNNYKNYLKSNLSELAFKF